MLKTPKCDRVFNQKMRYKIKVKKIILYLILNILVLLQI